MHYLTVDTEHEPGSVTVVDVSDRTPDVQTTVAVLGNVGDPHSGHACRDAEVLASVAGWYVSGAWGLVTDARVAPVSDAGSGPTGADLLGLERCAVCTNAFGYDADEPATYRWRRTGHAGFVCRYCADEVGRETPAEPVS